ncbi:hypothetical protein ACFOW6_02315 [Fodinicurvata halophila]|uniref:Uncharacterized protein n=1 Tax=Fodinicurvata halophila TaxID=1419723 RepID=A0ABV8UI92_9PROT
MIIVAATYLHIDKYIHKEKSFEENRKKFESELIKITREIYGNNFDINLHIDEGGTYLNVLIGAGALVSILSQGPSAISNVMEYGEKAVDFGSEVVEEVQDVFDVDEEEIDWKQRRRGDIKNLISIFKYSDIIKQDNMDKNSINEAKKELRRNLQKIYKKVNNIEELNLISKELPADFTPKISANIIGSRDQDFETFLDLPEFSVGILGEERSQKRGTRRRRRIYEATLRS